MIAAITCLTYCQYGEKLYPINQSINQSKNNEKIKMEKHFLFFLEDIDRLGIDYLRQNLPSDHRTFPMIAEKRKL